MAKYGLHLNHAAFPDSTNLTSEQFYSKIAIFSTFLLCQTQMKNHKTDNQLL